jgi:hypothetical protein
VGPRGPNADRALRQSSGSHGSGQGGREPAFGAFPRVHWRQIWSTNPLERLNKEIKRRSRVVGIFPNEASAIRLTGAVVLDINDEWASAERRYFSEASMAGLYPARDDDDATLGELVLTT